MSAGAVGLRTPWATQAPPRSTATCHATAAAASAPVHAAIPPQPPTFTILRGRARCTIVPPASRPSDPTPMVPLSRAIGRKRALEMLLTGEPISAATALEWGLVNRVVPASELDSSVEELVAAISRSSPLIVGIGKEAFYEQLELDEHRAYDLTKSVMAMNSMAADAQEGMCAFLEKRPPRWTSS